MQIIFVIIIVVIVSLLSAVGKKKPRQNAEDAPVRPTLSDIQRAFMMSNEMDTPQRRATETRQVSSFRQPTTQVSAKIDKPEMSSRLAETGSAFQVSNKYANIDLAAFHTDNDELSVTPKKVVRQPKSSLKLFEDKSDFVRAVIYSEILTRKAHR